MPMPSMYVARTGINTHIRALTVVSDNIANMNTIGFKASRAEFVDILPTGWVGEQFGRGVFIGLVRPLHTQGTLEFTDVRTDLAIDGDGFFILRDIPRMGIFYTRNGQFQIDKDGYLVSKLADGRVGLRVRGFQVYEYLENGQKKFRPVDWLSDVRIPAIMAPPKATVEATFKINLDSREEPPVLPFNPDDPATYNYATAITIYDSLGHGHQLTLFFRKNSAEDNTWDVFATIENGTITAGPGAPGVPEPQSARLVFDPEGALYEERDADGNLTDKIPITIEWPQINPTTGEPYECPLTPQTVFIDFGKNQAFEGATQEEALEGTTQFGSPFDTYFLAQDGYPVGHILNFTVAEDGLLTGYYSNGQTRPIAYIAIARFVNNEGLLRVGRTLWVETPESGQAIVGLASHGGRGKMLFKTLEQSNVDLANEFINMIVYQRAFQASSRVVMVSDAILADLAGLVR